MDSPCKDCKRREVGCHGSCEEYLRFSEERAEYNRRRREIVASSRYSERYMKAIASRKKYRARFGREV